MKTKLILVMILAALLGACSHKEPQPPADPNDSHSMSGIGNQG